jgi:hypothetical protein
MKGTVGPLGRIRGAGATLTRALPWAGRTGAPLGQRKGTIAGEMLRDLDPRDACIGAERSVWRPQRLEGRGRDRQRRFRVATHSKNKGRRKCPSSLAWKASEWDALEGSLVKDLGSPQRHQSHVSVDESSYGVFAIWRHQLSEHTHVHIVRQRRLMTIAERHIYRTVVPR